MTGKKKFILSLILILLTFAVFIFYQSYQLYTDKAKRSVSVLMTQYYKLLKSDPEAAKRALDLILETDPNNLEAMRALGFWYLKQGDTRSALLQFKLTYKLYPDDKLNTDQLRLLERTLGLSDDEIAANRKKTPIYITQLNWMGEIRLGLATAVADRIIASNELDKTLYIPTQSSNDIRNLATNVQSGKSNTNPTSTIPLRDQLLNQFYQNRLDNKAQAWAAINKLLLLYPNDLVALKEAGYYALGQNLKELSIDYFSRAYAVSHDPYLALQTGYILSSINRNKEAYEYFYLATKTKDLDERLKAEIALSNLRGIQTRLLPDRFFANIMYDPFYQSRFKLGIFPLIARAGYILSPEYNLSIYLSYRRTQDNRSNAANVLPQIYQDDAAITAIGMAVAPFKSFPIMGFVEAGKAVDLIYRNRSRWRNDFRIGLAYYNDWGREARYTFKHTIPLKFNADLYGDCVYYSRYINTIATLRARPGIEIWRFGATSLNVYWKAFISEDRNRVYYNNILETGPSISFTPSDRYNLTFRYENLRGFYLPSGGQAKNPYSSTYHNNYTIMDIFIGI